MSFPKHETDLILNICQGAGLRFNGTVCQYFMANSSECYLLKGGKIVAVYEHGRCLSIEEIHNKTEMVLRKWGYPDEFIDLKTLLYGRTRSDSAESGLLNARLRDPTITTLYSFVNRSIYNEVIQTLRSRGIFPEKKMCGSCLHLGLSSPRSCQLETIEDQRSGQLVFNRFFGQQRKNTDPVCAGYGKRDTCTQPLEQIENRAFSTTQASFPTADSVEAEQDAIENRILTKIDIELFQEWLIKRVVDASSPKQREIAQRQFDLFTRLCQLFKDHEDDPVKVFLDEISPDPKIREAHRKRTERDLREIEIFFREEMSKK